MTPTLNTRLLAFLLAPTLGLAVATHSFATDDKPRQSPQQPTAQGTAGQHQGQVQQGQGRNARASELIGTDIRNPQGEDLGNIEDLIINSTSGRVHYAVIAFGGFLGLGEKLFAYPVTALRASMTSDELVLDIDRERLSNAPGFERSRWPLWGRDTYHSDVDRYFDYTSDESGQGNFLRASELVGRDLEDAGGRDIGEIVDVVINVSQGKVSFVVVDFNRGGADDDLLHPVPFQALTLSGTNNERAMFTTSSQDFDRSRGFDSNTWPDLNDPQYRRDMDAQMDGSFPGTIGSSGSTTGAR